MTRERLFRHNEELGEFDWRQAARELDIDLETAQELVEYAVHTAGGVLSSRAPAHPVEHRVLAQVRSEEDGVLVQDPDVADVGGAGHVDCGGRWAGAARTGLPAAGGTVAWYAVLGQVGADGEVVSGAAAHVPAVGHAWAVVGTAIKPMKSMRGAHRASGIAARAGQL